jgi:outer membrane protein assembly factor BamE (lipoprotein component of BamABCDE complex)
MLKKVTVLFCALFVLAGCASTGNKVLKDESASTVAAKIEKGKSTKEDVRTIYGDPMHTSFTDSGKEIWTYEFVKGHMTASSFIPIVSLFASGSKGDKKELVVMFDDNGVVKNYSMSTSKVETNTSLFQ